MNIQNALMFGLIGAALIISVCAFLAIIHMDKQIKQLTTDVDKAAKNIIQQLDILRDAIAGSDFPRGYNAGRESERFYYDQ